LLLSVYELLILLQSASVSRWYNRWHYCRSNCHSTKSRVRQDCRTAATGFCHPL